MACTPRLLTERHGIFARRLVGQVWTPLGDNGRGAGYPADVIGDETRAFGECERVACLLSAHPCAHRLRLLGGVCGIILGIERQFPVSSRFSCCRRDVRLDSTANVRGILTEAQPGHEGKL
jgi:hypothetical protein